MALQEEFEKQGKFLLKYKGILPLIILSVGIFVFILTKINSTIYGTYFFIKIYNFLCLLISFIGLAIRVFTVGYSKNKTSIQNPENKLEDQLNFSGIYSLVRIPFYIGNFFMTLGISMLTQNFWFVITYIFLFCIYYERIIYAEEIFLRKKFGEIYLNWTKKTPILIPAFKNWVKPNIPFNWKKVLKTEKNRLVGIFLLFYFFALVENYIENENLLIVHWTFFCLIISILFYISIKIISKKTTLLNEEAL